MMRMRTLTGHVARHWVKWLVAPVVTVLMLASNSDRVDAASYTTGAIGDMGNITLSGTIAGSITVDIQQLVDPTTTTAQCTRPGGTNLTGGPTAGVVDFGTVASQCGSCTNGGDCYNSSATQAVYVATLRAVMTCSGGGSAGLEIYRATPGLGNWATTKVRWAAGTGTDWQSAAGDTVAEGDAIAPGTASSRLSVITDCSSPVTLDHQLAVRVDSADVPGSRTAAIVYRTF